MRIQTARHLLPFLLCAAALAGCGQKGDLYLPDEERKEQRAS
jgi:predicted small lipoprotein YifL